MTSRGQKMWNASRFCVSSLRRGHANLLCIVPILVYVLPKQVHQVPRKRTILTNQCVSGVPLAQWIARWTSNPKVLGSIPRWDVNKILSFSPLSAILKFKTHCLCLVRMAEWSKAPDSRWKTLLPDRKWEWDFWSSYEGRGSNPLSDNNNFW